MAPGVGQPQPIAVPHDQLRLLGEIDVGAGERLRFDGFRSGHHPVDGIDRVAIEVRSREVTDYSSGEVEL